MAVGVRVAARKSRGSQVVEVADAECRGGRPEHVRSERTKLAWIWISMLLSSDAPHTSAAN